LVYNIDVEQNSASKRTYNQQNYVKHNNSTTTLQPHTAQQCLCLRQLSENFLLILLLTISRKEFVISVAASPLC